MTADPAARERRVRAFCSAAALAGVVTVVVAAMTDGAGNRDWLLLVAFPIALAVAQLWPIHLVHRDDSEALQVEEAFFIPMAFLLAPVDVVLIVVLAVGLDLTHVPRDLGDV